MEEERIIITKSKELKRIVYSWLDSRLQEIKPKEKKGFDQDKLLTRKEAARFLKISLVTLGKLQKDRLPYKRLNGRVYFLKSEVMAALHSYNQPGDAL